MEILAIISSLLPDLAKSLGKTKYNTRLREVREELDRKLLDGNLLHATILSDDSIRTANISYDGSYHLQIRLDDNLVVSQTFESVQHLECFLQQETGFRLGDFKENADKSYRIEK